MSGRVETFLAARDLDAADGAAVEWNDLTPTEQTRVREVIAQSDDRLARRNLLLHPEAVPGDAVVSALLNGLRSDDGTLVLAAVVGAHRAAGRLSEPDRRTITGPVFEILRTQRVAVVRERASAALIVLSSAEDAQKLIAHLGDPDPVVGHNLRAALIRTLGPRKALAAVTDAAASRALPAEVVRFVDDGVDGGTASNHELIMRGVLAPQLASIADLEDGPG